MKKIDVRWFYLVIPAFLSIFFLLPKEFWMSLPGARLLGLGESESSSVNSIPWTDRSAREPSPPPLADRKHEWMPPVGRLDKGKAAVAPSTWTIRAKPNEKEFAEQTLNGKSIRKELEKALRDSQKDDKKGKGAGGKADAKQAAGKGEEAPDADWPRIGGPSGGTSGGASSGATGAAGAQAAAGVAGQGPGAKAGSVAPTAPAKLAALPRSTAGSGASQPRAVSAVGVSKAGDASQTQTSGGASRTGTSTQGSGTTTGTPAFSSLGTTGSHGGTTGGAGTGGVQQDGPGGPTTNAGTTPGTTGIGTTQVGAPDTGPGAPADGEPEVEGTDECTPVQENCAEIFADYDQKIELIELKMSLCTKWVSQDKGMVQVVDQDCFNKWMVELNRLRGERDDAARECQTRQAACPAR